MLHAVIMAGGSGTRFWPASRRMRPKQLLRLCGPKTMIQSTLDRLGDRVGPEHRYVITSEPLVDEIRKQLPDLPPANVVGEPCKRDTAPCIGLAAAMIASRDPDGLMLAMPSDHVITDAGAFRDGVAAAVRLVDEDPSRIVTFGVRPTYPAESFGYIQRGEPMAATGATAFAVDRFREKPDRGTAEQYVAAGTFYWNSGIFLWRAATILDAIRRFEPHMHDRLQRIAAASGTDQFDDVFREQFAAIGGKSIDYAVMEHYENVVVIEAAFPWDDVGSWQALSRLHEPDADGNTVVGSHVGIDTGDTIVHTEAGHTVVTIDVDNLIIVQTADATLVASKRAEQRVREAVNRLEEQSMEQLL